MRADFGSSVRWSIPRPLLVIRSNCFMQWHGDKVLYQKLLSSQEYSVAVHATRMCLRNESEFHKAPLIVEMKVNGVRLLSTVIVLHINQMFSTADSFKEYQMI